MPDAAIVLSDLRLYPLKSAAGIRVERAEAVSTGLRYDRRWMVVDAGGTFLTQREEPRLALVRVALEGDALVLTAPGAGRLTLPLHEGMVLDAGGGPREVSVWGEAVRAQVASPDAAAWISGHLGREADIVRFPDATERTVDPDFARPDDRVAFADGYPFLLIGEASLEDLNGRLGTPLGMERFRPNLVVRGSAPFAEDGWRLIRIGGVTFRVVKPCVRCAITTVDQDTAAVGKEPLRTLATFRRVGGPRSGKVAFGQNLLHDGVGALRVGEALEVLEART